jgi:capsular polysaccharide biosynthesis protein
MAHILSEVEMAAMSHPAMIHRTSVMAFPQYKCLYNQDGTQIQETRQTYIEPWVRKIPSLEAKIERVDQKYCPKTVEVPESLPRFKEPVIFLGTVTGHYGHTITDTMARLWAISQVDPQIKVLFLPLRTSLAQQEPLRTILNMLGIRENRLVRVKEPTLFESVVCPIPAIQWGSNIYENFVAPHSRVASAMGAGDPDLRRPTYLTRRGLGAQHRQILGEDLMEKKLRKEGFNIISPEQLSLCDQIDIFRHDHPVVGVIGSALHTLLFRESRDPKPVGMLTSSGVHGRFLLADAVIGAHTSYISCMTQQADSKTEEPVPLQEQTYGLDAKQAMDALDTAGMFSAPRRKARRQGEAGSGGAKAPTFNVPESLDFEKVVNVLKRDNPDGQPFWQYKIGETIELCSQEDTLWTAVICEQSLTKLKCAVVRRSAIPILSSSN